MTAMNRSVGAVILAAVGLLAGCAATQHDPSFQSDADACFRPRSFTEEIPKMYWGDPVRDPCWRFRRVVPDR
jgi:hypothetical protein